VILISGPWGVVPGAAALIAERVDVESSIRASVHPAELGDEAPLIGARVQALEVARSQVVDGLINSP